MKSRPLFRDVFSTIYFPAVFSKNQDCLKNFIYTMLIGT
jgi:hypothetical protein